MGNTAMQYFRNNYCSLAASQAPLHPFKKPQTSRYVHPHHGVTVTHHVPQPRSDAIPFLTIHVPILGAHRLGRGATYSTGIGTVCALTLKHPFTGVPLLTKYTHCSDYCEFSYIEPKPYLSS